MHSWYTYRYVTISYVEATKKTPLLKNEFFRIKSFVLRGGYNYISSSCCHKGLPFLMKRPSVLCSLSKEGYPSTVQQFENYVVSNPNFSFSFFNVKKDANLN